MVKELTRRMKDSGIEWIGEIPEDWEVVRLNRAIRHITTGLNPRQNFKLGEGNIYYVTIKNIKEGKVLLDEKCDTINRYAFILIQGRSKLRKNDILFSSIGTDPNTYLIKQDPENWNINESVFSIRPNINLITAKLLNYILNSNYFYDNLVRSSTGSTFHSIKMNMLKKNHLVLPPKLKQKTIANFLDKKMIEIDNIISKTKTAIAEYKKYKQSLITETVTRGLDKNVEMKDSGIEWIGEIPAHWDVIRLGFLGRLQNGINKSGEEFGFGHPFVNYGDIYRNYELDKSTFSGLVNSTEKERENYSVKKGDVLFTRTSETKEEIGYAATCLETIENSAFTGFAIRFRPFEKSLLDPKFGKYYFRSEMHRKYFVKEMNIVTRVSLSQELLMKLSVLLPPLKEQKAIASYLDQKTTQIDHIISTKEKLLTEMEAYKKSLIYETVTGKREVE